MKSIKLPLAVFLIVGCGHLQKTPETTNSTVPDKLEVIYSNQLTGFQIANQQVNSTSGGQGLCSYAATIEGPFFPQYKAYSSIWPDGTHAVRMATVSEIPGGYHYSTLYGYFNFVGAIPTLPRVKYSWQMRTPKLFSYDNTNYNGHAWLFRAQTLTKEIFSVRFLSKQKIGFFLNDQPMDKSIILKDELAGATQHRLSIDLEHKADGKIIFTFDDSKVEMNFDAKYEAPNREWVTSAGNALKHDSDLNYFSSLGPVEVSAVLPGGNRTPCHISSNDQVKPIKQDRPSSPVDSGRSR